MNTTVIARVDGLASAIRVKRPKFADMWSSYPNLPAGDVYRLVGGQAYALYQENPQGYANACALRLSRAFNYSAVPIAKSAAGYKVKGADDKQYLLRVRDMITFVRSNFGAPEKAVSPSGKDVTADFKGLKGILVFSVTGWGDATGHVTLWNGSDCGDHCYFVHDQPSVSTTLVQFWELK